MQSAAITKPDVLDDLPSIKASVGYRLDGQVIDYLTASLSTYARCEPIWEDLDGWLAPTCDARSLDDLPGPARRCIRAFSELIGCPIDLICVGSHRRQTIVVNQSFARS